MDLTNRIESAATAINAGRIKLLNSSDNLFVCEVTGRTGTYVTTISPAGCACNCSWGSHTPWGWSNPCYHALAAAGHVDLPVPLTGFEPTAEEDDFAALEHTETLLARQSTATTS